MPKITKTKKTLYGIVDNQTNEYIQDLYPKRRRTVESGKREKCQEIFMLRFLRNNDIDSLIFRYLDFHNIIYISVENIKQIAEIIKRTDRYVYDYINRLIEDNVMIRVNKGLYFVNPEYAIKGAIFNRQAKMKADYYKLKAELSNKPKKIKQPKLLKLKVVNE